MNHTDTQKSQGAFRRKNGLRSALTYLFLSVWAVVVLFPFYWMVLTSFKSYGAYNSEHTPVFFTLSPPWKTIRTPLPRCLWEATC